MLGKRKETRKSYDKEYQIPVIHASICTGEKVAGFKDRRTGAFEEVMLISNEKDMKQFLELYGISRENLKKEW